MEVKTIQYMLQLGLGISTLVTMVAFIGGAVFTIRTSLRYKNVRWVLVPALVEKSYVSKFNDGDGWKMYTPNVEYHYAYAGDKYQSTTISPDLFHYSRFVFRPFAQRWVSLFPVGTHLTAYVDPDNPSSAVLFPEYRYGWATAIGGAFAVFGFCNCLFIGVFAWNHFLG